MAALQAALREWREVLGPEYVILDEASRRRAETATFATTQTIPALLRPASRAEVQACLRVATAHGVPVYPVSGGRNWGFGSRVPARDGCVLLELARLDRILGFDEDLAYLTVEPGVTFAQAYEFLRQRGSRLFLNTIGGSPQASVLANALERGDGTGPHGERFAHVAALEVVLATGECVHTGFGRFAGSRVSPLHRWGVGPALEGLFSQSNLGVVTSLTVWLAPLPRSLHAVTFSIRDAARLPPLVDALRGLRLDGTLRSAIGLWNDYRVLSTRQGYPFERTGGVTPLGRDALAAVAEDGGRGRWFGLAGLYAATAAQGAAHRAHVQDVLGPVVDELCFDERSGEPASGRELFRDGDPALRFLQGIPHEGSVRSMYWRKRSGPGEGMAPEGDRCGVLWLCPTVPFTGADAAEAVALSEEIMPAHGFEPLLAVLGQTDRTLHLLPAIVYDRDVPGEDEHALACHDELLDRYCRLGFLPHRLGVASMHALPRPEDDTPEVLGRLRQALDPAGILAPGRYDFRPRGPA